MATKYRYIVYNKEQDEIQGYADTIDELIKFTKKTQRTVYNWLKDNESGAHQIGSLASRRAAVAGAGAR